MREQDSRLGRLRLGPSALVLRYWGTRKFGLTWVSIEGVRVTAVVAAVTSATSFGGESRSSFGDRGGFPTAAASVAAAVGGFRGGGDRCGGGGGGGGYGGGGGGGGGSAAAAAVASAAAVGGGGFAAAAARGGGMPPQVVGEGKGVVKFFNPQKGFGFIVRDDGGEDVFVHISAVEQAGLTDLADGQPLEFTLVDRGGRISATNLRIDGEPMAVVRAERAPGAVRR